MKTIKKDILINKYNKIKRIKNSVKKNIIKFFIHNNNLSLKNKSMFLFLNNVVFTKKKKNLCLITSRKRGVNRTTNLSRLQFRKFARLGVLDNFKIN
jgi:ribosomal protein S14